jgi:hypothetical protein
MVIKWPVRSAPAAPAREGQLDTDKLDLKAQIRTALADLATRHGIAAGEVDHVMWAYIDQAVDDLTFTYERGVAPAEKEPTPNAPVLAFGRPRSLN